MPLPSVSAISPPRPSVAAPVPSSNAPELPVLADPDEKISIPLAPFPPEFADRMVIAPLDVAVPSPDAIVNTPPVFTVLRPATVP